MIYQNLLTNTYGLFNSIRVNYKGLQAMKVFMKNPVVYAFLLGLVFIYFLSKYQNTCGLRLNIFQMPWCGGTGYAWCTKCFFKK